MSINLIDGYDAVWVVLYQAVREQTTSVLSGSHLFLTHSTETCLLQMFIRAKKSPRCPWQVYVASALMEWRHARQQEVARKIFEKGLEVAEFATTPEFILAYAEFLCGELASCNRSTRHGMLACGLVDYEGLDSLSSHIRVLQPSLAGELVVSICELGITADAPQSPNLRVTTGNCTLLPLQISVMWTTPVLFLSAH